MPPYNREQKNMGQYFTLTYSRGEFTVAARRVSFGYNNNYAEWHRTQQIQWSRRTFGGNRRISYSPSRHFFTKTKSLL
jgi:hypothetical protein